jgi:hypothetical protein
MTTRVDPSICFPRSMDGHPAANQQLAIVRSHRRLLELIQAMRAIFSAFAFMMWPHRLNESLKKGNQYPSVHPFR